MRRWIWIGLAVLAVGAIALSMFREDPVEVDLATVASGSMEVTLDEEGITRVRERYSISAPVSGRVLRITLEPGDEVAEGGTVVTFRPAPSTPLDARTRQETESRLRALEAAVGRAEAERARASTEDRLATTDLERTERLAQERIVSQETIDTARLRAEAAGESLRAAEFGVRAARFELEQVRATLADTADDSAGPIEIPSPIVGVVLTRLRESSAVVSAGEPLIEIGDPANLEIVADYLSEDAVRISPGASVHIERWGGERALRGRVRRVEPSGFTKVSALGVEEQRVNVLIDFEDSDTVREALGDGYRVEVRVVIWKADDVRKVPVSSLFRHEGGWAVFREVDGEAVLTAVDVGRRNGLEAEVRDGVSAGDRVVLHPSDAVGDGVAVVEREL